MYQRVGSPELRMVVLGRSGDISQAHLAPEHRRPRVPVTLTCVIDCKAET